MKKKNRSSLSLVDKKIKKKKINSECNSKLPDFVSANIISCNSKRKKICFKIWKYFSIKIFLFFVVVVVFFFCFYRFLLWTLLNNNTQRTYFFGNKNKMYILWLFNLIDWSKNEKKKKILRISGQRRFKMKSCCYHMF